MIETCNSPASTSDLDFRADFLRRHFEKLQDTEKLKNITSLELKYTFLERFAKENLVHYKYHFEEDRLVSPGYEDLGAVADRLEAAIEERKSLGKSTNREEAELGGFTTIEKHLAGNDPVSGEFYDTGSLVFVLYSPSPPKDELADHKGYADYNFIYFGKYDPMDHQVEMFAWRNYKTIDQQSIELNSLADKQIIGAEAHPNDFLRQPVFARGDNFDVFRQVILDIPDDEKFVKAKEADYAQYRDGIDNLSEMLVGWIEKGAGEETLLKAQLAIEMEFVKWSTDSKVNQSFKVDYGWRGSPLVFEQDVMAKFAIFAAKYNTAGFACGSCGGSVMSLFSSTSPISLTMEISMPEFFVSYISCPNCSKRVRKGAESCGACGIKKSDWDSRASK